MLIMFSHSLLNYLFISMIVGCLHPATQLGIIIFLWGFI